MANLLSNAAKRAVARVKNIVNPTAAGKAAQANVVTAKRSSVVRTPEGASAPITGNRGSGLINPGAGSFVGNPVLNPSYQLKGSGNPVYSTPEELEQAWNLIDKQPDLVPKNLRFTEEQYKAAWKILDSDAGARGVDPLGLGNTGVMKGVGSFKTLEEAKEFYYGKIIDDPNDPNFGNFMPSEEYQRTGSISPEGQAIIENFENPQYYEAGQTGEINAPRGSTVRAVAGAPLQSAQAGAMGRADALGINEGTTFEDQKIAELRSLMSEPIMAPTVSGGTTIDKNATRARDEKYSSDIRQYEAQKEANLKAAMVAVKDAQKATGITEVTPEAPVLPQSSIANSTTLNQMLVSAFSDPSMANAVPMIQDLLNTQSKYDAEFMLNRELSGIDTGQGVRDVALSEQQIMLQRAEKQDAFNEKTKEIAIRTADLSKSISEAAIKMQEIETQYLANKKREENIEGEKKNRRIANKLGITSDTSGLEWMQAEVRKGTEALDYLRQTATIANTSARLQMAESYKISIDKALNTYDQNQFVIDDNLRKELKDIKNTVSLDKEERDKARKDAWTNYYKAKNEEDKTANENLKFVVEELMDRESEQREAEETAKSDGWRNLIDTFTKFEAGSSMRKQALQNAKDAGADVSSIDINDNSLSASLKSDKAQQEESIQKLSEMTIGNENPELGRWAALASGGRRSIRARIDEAGFLIQDFESGDIDLLKRNIIVAARNGMDVTTGKKMDAAALVQADVDLITWKMQGFDSKFGGIFTAAKEGGAKFIKQRDAEWLDLKADIGLQIADTRNKYAGVAVTETEMKFINVFLPNFIFDTVGEMELKLNNVRENATLERINGFNQMLGSPNAYQELTGETIKFLEKSRGGKTRIGEEWSDEKLDTILRSRGGSPETPSMDVDFPPDTPPPKIIGYQDAVFVTKEIAGKQVKGQQYLVNALEAANRDMIASTGGGLKIGEHFRTVEQQRELYAKSQRDEIGRAAPPGQSFHERGLAVDIINWEEAQSYLARYGIVNGLEGDMGHFSIGEMNRNIIALLQSENA